MINAKTILMMQPIAAEMVEKGQTFAEHIGPVIQGLNGESYSGFGYVPENIVKALPVVTKNDTKHSELLDTTSTMLAVSIRSAFNDIKTYIVPFADKVCQKFYQHYDGNYLAQSIIFDRLYLSFEYTDKDIFSNTRYPSEIKNTFLDYEKVNLRELIKGTYPRLTTEFIEEYLQTNDTEINELIESRISTIRCMYDDFFASYEEGLERPIAEDSVESDGGIVNFRTKRFNPEDLFAFYIFLSKMYSDDKPLEGVTGVDLATYRANVAALWHCITAALISTKQRYQSYQNLGMFIIPDSVPRKEMYRNEFGVITGSVHVYVTKAAVKELEAASITASEMVAGYYIGTLIDNKPTGFTIAKRAEYKADYTNYVEKIEKYIGLVCCEGLNKVVSEELDAFQKEFPQFGEVIAALNDELPYRRLSSHMERSLPLLTDAFKHSFNNGKTDIRQLFLSNQFVVNFMDALGMKLSAKLIGHTYSTQSDRDDMVAQRKNLTRAVIETVIAGQFVHNK